MAFETGTTSSPSDLLSKLNTFLTANGWTSNTGGTGGDPANSQYSFNDGAGGHFHLIPQNTNGEIHGQPATGYINSSTQFYAHTGSPSTAGTAGTFAKCGGLPTSGTNTYWFFAPNAAPRFVHVVVRFTAGEFTHLSFGTGSKYGTFTGARYMTALSWRPTVVPGIQMPFSNDKASTHSAHYVQMDGAFGLGSPPNWFKGPCFGFGNLTQPATWGWSFALFAGGLIDQTQRTPFAPIYLKAEQAGTPGQTIIMGHVVDARLCSMESRNPDGEVVTIGSDQWYIFPVRRTGATPLNTAQAYDITGTQPNHVTNYAGLAYRRVD